MDIENITVTLAFLGGFLAFISPCTLPLYPTFISYITGITVTNLNQKNNKSLIIMHSIAFCCGLSIINFVLGFSFSFIGRFFLEYNDLIRMLGGIFLVLMGLFLIGIFKPESLMKDIRLFKYRKATTLLNSFFVGIVFAAGWTPCIGPILGSILYTSLSQPEQTFINISAYSLGFSLPFIFMGLIIEKINFFKKYSGTLMKVGGYIIIIIGIMVFFDKINIINSWASQIQYYLEDMLLNKHN